MTDSPPTNAGSLLPCKCGAPAICGQGQDLRFPEKPMLAYVAQCSRIIACDASTFSRHTWDMAAKAWNRQRIMDGADFTLAAWHAKQPDEPAAKPDIARALMYLEEAREHLSAGAPAFVAADLDEVELSLRANSPTKGAVK